METCIYEGTVLLDRDKEKVYLGSTKGGVVDLNSCLSRLVGENIKVIVTKVEEEICR